MHASRQWANRPDDERYLSLEDLAAAVKTRRDQSEEKGVALEHLEVAPEDGEIVLKDGFEKAKMTNWTFSQLARRAGAPASYLRTLPAEFAVIPLMYSMTQAPRGDGKVLITDTREKGGFLGRQTLGGMRTARALTSPSYGRIWDHDVVESLQSRLDPTVWMVPAASYTSSDPKRATTLYASDRDVFIFLVSPDHPIEVPGTNGGETMFRGFFAWNSETGSKTFGLSTFLYRYVCDNRIVWGAEQVTELRIRHTPSGPTRFMREAQPYLQNYLESGTTETVAAIQAAQDKEVGKNESEVVRWLTKNKGFTKTIAKAAAKAATEEPGNPRSVWNLVQGLTASARDTKHADTRVSIESKAGKLLQEVK